MKEVLEVKVTWGTQVLSVRHLEPGEGFTFGDVPIVLGRRGGWLVSKPGSEPAVVIPAQRVSMEVEGVTIDIAALPAVEEKVERGVLASIAEGAVPIISFSFIGHVSILATMASFEPPPKRPITEGPPPEQLFAMKALLEKADEREAEEYPEGLPLDRARIYEVMLHWHAVETEYVSRVVPVNMWAPPARIDEEEETRPRLPPPQLRQGKVTASGKLPVEVIQRIVRQNFGRFRLCYESGLRRNPKLREPSP